MGIFYLHYILKLRMKWKRHIILEERNNQGCTRIKYGVIYKKEKGEKKA